MKFDASTGSLEVLTGVDGVAARMGHRLTILVQSWSAELTWDGDEPATLTLTADVNSFSVEGGEGGVTPLSPPERVVARANALKTMSSKRFPHITFESSTIESIDNGYRLTGQLEIRGQRREHVVDVTVAGATVTARSGVRQSDFGIKPYSMMMGSLRVADEVTVTLNASATDSHR